MENQQVKKEKNGIQQFTNELQRFNIKIEENRLAYNGFADVSKYSVFLQNLYLSFNKQLYAELQSIKEREEQVEYLKTLKNQLAEIDENLLQNRDLLAYFESMLALNSIKDYSTVLSKLEGMNVYLDAKTEQHTEPGKIDTISFIDKQINFSYKALSLLYNMITLEEDIPSFYGVEEQEGDYQFKWKGSKEELAELFVELQRKNWIEKLQPRDVGAAVQSIENLFDLSRTSVKEQNKKTDPLTTILKGRVEQATGEQTYPGIYQNGYEQKFTGIRQNEGKTG